MACSTPKAPALNRLIFCSWLPHPVPVFLFLSAAGPQEQGQHPAQAAGWRRHAGCAAGCSRALASPGWRQALDALAWPGPAPGLPPMLPRSTHMHLAVGPTWPRLPAHPPEACPCFLGHPPAPPPCCRRGVQGGAEEVQRPCHGGEQSFAAWSGWNIYWKSVNQLQPSADAVSVPTGCPCPVFLHPAARWTTTCPRARSCWTLCPPMWWVPGEGLAKRVCLEGCLSGRLPAVLCCG